MDSRAYQKELTALTSTLSKAQTERNTLILRFKAECKHPATKLTSIRSYAEDEYGRYQPSWSEYGYTCGRCNTVLRGLGAKLKDIESIQSRMILQNKEENQ